MSQTAATCAAALHWLDSSRCQQQWQTVPRAPQASALPALGQPIFRVGLP